MTDRFYKATKRHPTETHLHLWDTEGTDIHLTVETSTVANQIGKLWAESAPKPPS